MKILQIGGIIAATTITAIFPLGNNPSAKPNAAIEAEMNPEWQSSFVPSAEPVESSQHDASALPEENADADTPETQQPNSADAFPFKKKMERNCPMYPRCKKSNKRNWSEKRTISRFGIIQRRPRQTYRIPLFVPTSHFRLHKNRQRLF
jgi:hypothetical protein